jgi:hypothetical protein
MAMSRLRQDLFIYWNGRGSGERMTLTRHGPEEREDGERVDPTKYALSYKLLAFHIYTFF